MMSRQKKEAIQMMVFGVIAALAITALGPNVHHLETFFFHSHFQIGQCSFFFRPPQEPNCIRIYVKHLYFIVGTIVIWGVAAYLNALPTLQESARTAVNKLKYWIENS